MTIGEVAERSGVNSQTIRFYERRGLVLPDARSEAGYRQYTEAAVQRVRFIKHAQEIGFSLKEIGELLSLRVDENTTCADVRGKAQQKIAAIEIKIRNLRHVRKALLGLVARCDVGKPVTDCPILEALDEADLAR